ncbi:P-glycoprotein, partial [Entamoeba invadens IP1]
IRELFRYASVSDLLLLFTGILGSLAVGVLNPLLMLLTGKMVDNFVQSGSSTLPNIVSVEMNQKMLDTISSTANDLVLKMVYFSIGNMVAGFLQTFCFFVLSQRQGIKIRTLYFKALLRQDMEWYDFHEAGELTARISSDVQQIEDGMSSKFGVIFQTIAAFITGYAMGFALCWDLTLVILCMSPFTMMSMMGLGMSAGIFTKKSIQPFGEAGAIAEETIGNMRTVQALGKEEFFCKEYNEKIEIHESYKVKKSIGIGTGLGCMMFCIMASNALGTWYGNLVLRGKGGSSNSTAGTVMVVFMSVLLATQSLSQVSTPMNILATAKASAFRIYETIDRIPNIDIKSTFGEVPPTCEGNIEFEDVQFSYPTRLAKVVLHGLDLTIRKGETIALVGASGCGKSTTIQLIQRMYDLTGGYLKIDGRLITTLNIKWLRNQIGLVGQEPVLFSCSIKENILLGAKEGETPTDDDVIRCAKMANAHDFIIKLVEGYDTLVGERGAQLSGGQKQRIAIARALIRNPKILLLDEATSALDTQSEKIVQSALEEAAKGRTTLVVAHRLSTVRNADKICVFHQGEIIESGTHEELMSKKGSYYNLVKRQSMEDETDQETVENDLKKIKQDENAEIEKMNNERNDESEALLVQSISREYQEEKKRLKTTNRFVLFRVILNNYRHEYILSILGLIGAIGAGAAFPFYSLKFVDMLLILMRLEVGTDLTNSQSSGILKNCLLILLIGVTTMISFFFYVGLFMAAGEKMISRLRKRFYRSILRQNIGWFDRKENMVGAVTTRLSSDPTSLGGISAERVGDLLEIFATVCFGLGIALYFDWKLALCVIAK